MHAECSWGPLLTHTQLYAKVFATGEKLLADVLSSLGFTEPSSSNDKLFAVNTLSWTRSDIVQIPSLTNEAMYGTLGSTLGLPEITPLVSTTSPAVSIKKLSENVYKLSNDAFDVRVDNGAITSLYDKAAKREVIPEGQRANQLVIFDDKPLYWQAWDVEVYHLDSREELHPHKSIVIEDGPYRVSLESETRISSSSWIKTTISLTAVSPSSSASTSLNYIEMSSEVEWHEDKKFLKVEFPVDVVNTSASYETQFGIVRRPTHYNTTWDMAKFEVCCHKWADLSEAGYGVSILNDSKYGFATQGNVMRLSLLRAPKAPDAHADMKRHHFRYAILPHAGPLDHKTIRTAFEFNNPISTPQRGASNNNINTQLPLFPYTTTTSYIRAHPSPTKATELLSAFRMSPDSSPAIVIDTVKRGEDDYDIISDLEEQAYVGKTVVGAAKKRAQGERSVILRLYDSLGGRARGKVEFHGLAGKVTSVRKVNLLEDDAEGVIVKDGGFEVELRAFEVASFRVVFGRSA